LVKKLSGGRFVKWGHFTREIKAGGRGSLQLALEQGHNKPVKKLDAGEGRNQPRTNLTTEEVATRSASLFRGQLKIQDP